MFVIKCKRFGGAIFDELQRIAETYKSDYEIAKAREDSVQQSLNEIVSESQTTNEAQITLHNLESSAQTARALYDNFLQRYMESVQQQSFPVTEARLITRATQPLYKSAPRTPLIMGGAAGRRYDDGHCFWRVAGNFRPGTSHQSPDRGAVERRLHRDGAANKRRGEAGWSRGQTIRPSRGSLREKKACCGRWSIRHFHRLLSRSALSKLLLIRGKVTKGGKVIGITSSLPNEGKSTIATALAEITAQGGGRTVLVDCDLRNPSLSRKLAPQAEWGLSDILANTADFKSIVWADTVTGFQFLPAGVRLRIAHSSDLLASNKAKAFFEALRESYDYIIVDLAPLAPVVDVHAMTHLVDCFIFVVEWGQTKVDVVKHALDTARGVYDNLLGVVLNKADVNAMRRYEANRADYYYNRNYARYGYVE